MLSESLGLVEIKAISSLVAVILYLLIQKLINSSIQRVARKRNMEPTHTKIVNGTFKAILFFILIIALLAIWGIKPKDAGLFISGLLGLIAIGFFAVWSILSNIVAGLLLFISAPFKINDEIVVLPDETQGTVVDMGLFFVVLKDEKESLLNIPNNLFFQKTIKTIKNKK
jgi:MscS family membrane protein